MYMLLNPSVQKHMSLDEFPNKNRITNMDDYNSGSVEKISKDEMKKIIIDSGLLE